MAQERAAEEKRSVRRPEQMERPGKRHDGGSAMEAAGLAGLQQRVGNQAVQRLVAQRSGQGAFELDETTAKRIDRERGGGHPLDSKIQQSTGAAMGHDVDEVRVHTSPEADTLSRQLGAKAFTTGQDVFFREGAYDPHSSAGQQLIAHELTHVGQQSAGKVNSGSGMTVSAPGDVHEREAEAVAKKVTGAGAEVHRQAEEEEVQMQPEEEEEEIQTQPEEEEEVQMQPLEERLEEMLP